MPENARTTQALPRFVITFVHCCHAWCGWFGGFSEELAVPSGSPHEHP